MEDYRRLQALKWEQQQQSSGGDESTIIVKKKPVIIDSCSLNSIIEFNNKRTGILFGKADDEDITIDAIYECSQDVITGEALMDSRLIQVRNLSSLMGLKPLGILVTSDEESKLPGFLIRLCNMHNFSAYILLIILPATVIVYEPTDACFRHVKAKTLRYDTTLKGPTVDGGLYKKDLVRSLDFTKREVNTIIHTGFFRLNRPDHIPTIEDVKAFLIARKDIPELYLKLADYHLILFLADVFGESTGERIILSIFREDDELVKDLIDILLL